MPAATSFLTPKPTYDVYRMPTCPPPPRPAHQPTTLPSLPPALNFPSCFDDAEGSSSSDVVGLSIDAQESTPECPSSGPKALPAKRRRAVLSRRPLLSIKLKPRPSKYVPPPNRPPLVRSPSKAGLQLSMSRSPSYQMLMRPNKRPSLARRPSFSRAA